MIITVTPNPGLDRTIAVSRLAFDEVLRAQSVRLDWGGKGFNVSRALKALGADSVAIGFLGGATGNRLQHGLANEGIEVDAVPILQETRVCTVIRQIGSDRHVKVNEPGPVVCEAEVSGLVERVKSRARSGDWCVLSGSLPPGAPASLYARLVDALSSTGARVVLDTSGQPLRLGVRQAPFVIKPNRLELAELASPLLQATSGGECDVVDAAIHLVQQGIGLVAVSLDRDGARLVSSSRVVWARPPSVRISCAVGAGDALVAGMLWALWRELPLDEVARWAVAAGTVAAAKPGVGFGSLDEVREMCTRVCVTCT
jgi:1-phosphofructokinase family hexose kinase